VIALRRAALHAAQAEFAQGRARKTYWAVVQGRMPAASGCVDLSLAKRVAKSGWRMWPDPAGQAAVTLWRVLGHAGEKTWLELSPRTGRTHQIRVHCAAIGHPVLGDPIYGTGGRGLHLLARAIRLDLDPVLAAVAPPPAAMRAALSACGWLPEDEPDAKQQGLMPGLA
jgi:23S rRNA-/tRNA-specific pseudouridylate synthase